MIPAAPADVDDVTRALTANGYLPDEGLATAVFLAVTLRRPLLLEGEAGVGKTEVAKVLAAWTGGELIRLQCYEGIDASQAVYDWDYARQLLHLRATEISGEATGRSSDSIEAELYQERFLIKRALLRAIEEAAVVPPILLIDEIDRADDEFEAFLLELLSDYSVTIPELGEIRAVTPPVVILTSNRTRDLHDALKRAEKSMEPVLTQFRDQVLFLKHNLNAQALSSLQKESLNIQDDITKLLAEMDRSIRQADSFIKNLE